MHPTPSQPDHRLNLLLSWGGWRPDSWADRMACLLEPMGVQSLRVRTARQAEQVIRTTAIHVAVVDLGLPMDFGASAPCEDAGPRVLEMLKRATAGAGGGAGDGGGVPTVIVRSPRSQRDACREMTAALHFNAFAVVDRRSADVEQMLKLLQRVLERHYQGRWPSASGN